jgi:aminopeptidase N
MLYLLLQIAFMPINRLTQAGCFYRKLGIRRLTDILWFSCILWTGLLITGALEAQRPSYGGPLLPEQANMDVRHYKIDLSLDIPNRSLSGSTEIRCNLLKSAHTILFDLMDSFQVRMVWVNKKAASFVHENHRLYIRPAVEGGKGSLAAGGTSGSASNGGPRGGGADDSDKTEGVGNWPAGPVTVTVAYSGHPMIAKRPPWDDGFTFTKDSTGHAWVAVTAEGTGGKIFFPAKDHPSDEPDEGVDLIVAVPKDLVVAGPGKLVDVKQQGDRKQFHWQTNYPINNYSIVFNVGDYEVVSRDYTTVDGHHVPMQFYVLKEHAAQAAHLLEMMAFSAQIKEKYFGEYPWVKDKIGLVETPHLGMEHQTMNAYGNKFHYTKIGGKDFDWLMNHEFGHEWWGNKVTAGDWADYWIHEGIGSFGDALYTRDLEGEIAYEKIFQGYAPRILNDKPVVMGKDIEEEEAYHPDIYAKGAFFMHTLRYVLGDSVFFPALKRLATDSEYTYTHTVNTTDVERLFSRAAGKDLSPLFHLYLYTTDKLEIHVRQLTANRWKLELANIDMPLPVDVITDQGTLRMMLDRKGTTITSITMPILDARMFYLKKVIYE